MSTESMLRVVVGVSLLCTFAVSGFIRRRADRRGGDVSPPGGAWRLALVRMVALVAMVPLVAWLVAPNLWPATRIDLPLSIRIFGAALVVACVPLLVWVLRSLGDSISPSYGIRSRHQLVQHGPYAWLRHPLYTFGFLAWLGVLLASGVWSLVPALGIGAAYILRRTPLEERKLVAAFGDAYREYAQQTGRYWPRMGE